MARSRASAGLSSTLTRRHVAFDKTPFPSMPVLSQLTQDPSLILFWSTVYDAGPTSNQCKVNCLCLLGYKCRSTETTAAVVLIPLLHDQSRLPFLKIIGRAAWYVLKRSHSTSKLMCQTCWIISLYVLLLNPTMELTPHNTITHNIVAVQSNLYQPRSDKHQIKLT